jgi:hypothetical protein
VQVAYVGGRLLGWHAHSAAALESETVRAWRAVRALDLGRLTRG